MEGVLTEARCILNAAERKRAQESAAVAKERVQDLARVVEERAKGLAEVDARWARLHREVAACTCTSTKKHRQAAWSSTPEVIASRRRCKRCGVQCSAHIL
jgi:hypothetical protein